MTGYSLSHADDVEQMFLAHHGIKGQKWGVRRYQYPDGRLTPEGKIRYSKSGKNDLYANKNVDGVIDIAMAASPFLVSAGLTMGDMLTGKTFADSLADAPLRFLVANASLVRSGMAAVQTYYDMETTWSRKREE